MNVSKVWEKLYNEENLRSLFVAIRAFCEPFCEGSEFSQRKLDSIEEASRGELVTFSDQYTGFSEDFNPVAGRFDYVAGTVVIKNAIEIIRASHLSGIGAITKENIDHARKCRSDSNADVQKLFEFIVSWDSHAHA